MGKLSRIKNLGQKYLDRVNLKKQIEDKLKTVTEPMKAEARANTANFSKWWLETYPEEYAIINSEVKLNKNIPKNTAKILKRMDDWRKGLTYD
jgi:hypothetical protein